MSVQYQTGLGLAFGDQCLVERELARLLTAWSDVPKKVAMVELSRIFSQLHNAIKSNRTKCDAEKSEQNKWHEAVFAVFLWHYENEIIYIYL